MSPTRANVESHHLLSNSDANESSRQVPATKNTCVAGRQYRCTPRVKPLTLLWDHEQTRHSQFARDLVYIYKARVVVVVGLVNFGKRTPSTNV